MILTVERRYKKPTYTIGMLYVNGKFFSNTLEDTDRGLNSDMSGSEIMSKKVYGNTAIPRGTYEITLDVISPKYCTNNFYKQVCNGKVPRLLNVKGFEGILIHVGEGYNGKDLTSGCLLVGMNTIKGGLTRSKECFKELYKKLKTAVNNGEKITITVK